MRRLTLNLGFVLALLSVITGPLVPLAQATKVIAGDLRVTGTVYQGLHAVKGQSAYIYNVLDYGAKGDVTTVNMTLSGGTATCAPGGAITCAEFANTYGDGTALIKVPAAIETSGLSLTLTNQTGYTKVDSTTQHFYTFDVGWYITSAAAGWGNDGTHGVINATTPADFTGSNEVGWHLQVTPQAPGTTGTQTCSVFRPLTATISSISSGVPALTGTNGTLSSNANWTVTCYVAHDDTAAFQAAVDAANAAGGGTLTAPYANYAVKNVVLKDHVHTSFGTDKFTMVASAPTASIDLNSGGSGMPSFFTASGSLAFDDPQMAQWTGSTGAPAGTITSSGTSITGSGTSFDTLLQPGDSITVPTGSRYQVATVGGPTSLTLTTAPTVDFIGSSWSYRKLPCFPVAGGSLTNGTTYYYEVTGLNASGVETAASQTREFAKATGTTLTIDYALVVSAYPAITTYRVYRGAANATTGVITWGKLRDVAAATFNGGAGSDEWTDNNANTIALKDDGSVNPNTAVQPPTTNQSLTRVSDIVLDGGNFQGDHSVGLGVYVTYGSSVTVSNASFTDDDDSDIKFLRSTGSKVIHCQLSGGTHGVIAQDSQHTRLLDCSFDGETINPVIIDHDQTGAASTLDAPNIDTTIDGCSFTHWGADYGAHSEGIIVYGSLQAVITKCYFTHSLSQNTAICVRYRDSEGKVTDCTFDTPEALGVKADAIDDFSHNLIGATDSSIYAQRVQSGGSVEVGNCTFVKCATYGILASTASASVPAGVAGHPEMGAFSSLPTSSPGVAATQMQVLPTYLDMRPVNFHDNIILDTGFNDLSSIAEGIVCNVTGSILRGNIIDGANDAGIQLQIIGPIAGANVWTHPDHILASGNAIHNVGRATSSPGSADLTYKVGIYSQGAGGSYTDNDITCQDSGVLGSSTAIVSGVTTSSSPWGLFSYTAKVASNAYTNCASTTSFLANSGGGKTSTALDSQSMGRLSNGVGSALVTGDFGTLTGFGTASVTAVSGTDRSGSVTITVTSTTGASANPFVVLTFHDGAWPSPPKVVASFSSASSGTHLAAMAGSSTTTATLGLIGTIAATGTYIINWWAAQ